MGNIEFINPNRNEVHLLGPDKIVETFAHNQRKVLPDYFIRYVPRYLKVLRNIDSNRQQMPVPKVTPRAQTTPPQLQPQPVRPVIKARIKPQVKLQPSRASQRAQQRTVRNVVGRTKLILSDAEKYYRQYINQANHSISNDIGIGILSYNRLGSLSRLIDSIRRYTDLKRTTVFISDESTDNEVKQYIRSIPDMTVIDNSNRLGVAGNTNRLMRCLDRFKNRIILNDDVEILNAGWDRFYFDVMLATKYHHFCMRQAGLLGAVRGEKKKVNGFDIFTVPEKPHGAVFVYDYVAAEKVGFMDEEFGVYGMEHVDWSNRVSLSGIQPSGFHDVDGSEKYFRIHDDKSAVSERIEMLIAAKRKFIAKSGDVKRIFINCSNNSILPAVSYIVPFKDANIMRKDSIIAVIQNIKSQKFPIIDIILAEQDSVKRVSLDQLSTVRHVLAPSSNPAHPFTKSVAFNVGFMNARADKVILHDADMIVRDEYTKIMYNLLCKHPGVHIGANVLYLDQPSTERITTSLRVDPGYGIMRSVGYFEGGSLGCTSNTYIEIGGFNDNFVGYGCFAPGNFILTDSGYKAIESFNKNDLLYTHEGTFEHAELRIRQYSGEILNIYIPGRLPIKGVTPEHPFLVKDGSEFTWKMANDLIIGDEILDTDFMPELVRSFDLYEIMRLDNSKNKFNIFNNMDEFSYLLGLYLAEGVIQTPERLRVIYYYIHKDEKFLAEHVEEIVKVINDKINVTYDYIKNNCREVRVFNSLLAKLIYAVAGKYKATQKLLSYNFIKSLSDSNIQYLLGGMIDGDGNHQKGSKNRLVYHTSSINLAMLASGMMRRLGINHSFSKRSGGSFDNNSEFSYDLTVNREFENKILNIYPREKLIGSSAFGRSTFGKVYEISSHKYDGPVYNFEVDNTHSYVVNGLVVHNCEDTEFYKRLAAFPGFFGERTENLIHLFHGRSDGWNVYHQKNKLLETKLYAQNMNARYADGKIRFMRKYNVDISNRWV